MQEQGGVQHDQGGILLPSQWVAQPLIASDLAKPLYSNRINIHETNYVSFVKEPVRLLQHKWVPSSERFRSQEDVIHWIPLNVFCFRTFLIWASSVPCSLKEENIYKPLKAMYPGGFLLCFNKFDLISQQHPGERPTDEDTLLTADRLLAKTHTSWAKTSLKQGGHCVSLHAHQYTSFTSYSGLDYISDMMFWWI